MKSKGRYLLSVMLLIVLWWIASMAFPEVILPSPGVVMKSAILLAKEGVLGNSILMSLYRIIMGWAIGGLGGIVFGLFMGRIKFVEDIIWPHMQFLRFIPPIAFVTLFIIWFGMGERSKILLVVYGTMFIVVINTMSGVFSTKHTLIEAAQCLGASGKQVFLYVFIPSTVPFIITGLRIALGNSFMTIVAAEMLAANSGLGFIIWTSRNFMLTDQIFVAIICLGLLGMAFDRGFHLVSLKLLKRYGTV